MKNIQNHLHKEKIRACFNRAAQTYDQASQVQLGIGNQLIQLLGPYQPKTAQMIDLGCGSGLVTQQWLAAFPCQLLYALDSAEDLLLEAKKKLARDARIHFHEQDFENFNYEPLLFDLAFSNMSLQWSLALNEALATTHRHLHQNGLFAFSIPLEGTFLELNQLKPGTVNPFYTSEALVQLLGDVNFKLLMQQTESITLHFDSFIKALKSIKNMGANYSFNTTPTSLGAKPSSAIKRIKTRFSLTYKIGYFIAQK